MQKFVVFVALLALFSSVFGAVRDARLVSLVEGVAVGLTVDLPSADACTAHQIASLDNLDAAFKSLQAAIAHRDSAAAHTAISQINSNFAVVANSFASCKLRSAQDTVSDASKSLKSLNIDSSLSMSVAGSDISEDFIQAARHWTSNDIFGAGVYVGRAIHAITGGAGLARRQAYP